MSAAPTIYDEVEYPGHPWPPLHPRRLEADWLVTNVREEIARSQGIAPETLLDDYRRALQIYEQLAGTAQ